MFSDIFTANYYDGLNSSLSQDRVPDRDRGDSMLKVFSILESDFSPPYNIIETGCVRPYETVSRRNIPDNDRLRDEGSSTVIFDEFVNYYDGTVRTVDLNQDACNYCNEMTSAKTTVTCLDSIEFLWQTDLSNTCLFYLDSYDVDFKNPIMANFHHMKELVCISKYLKDTLVVVDDCRFSQQHCNSQSKSDLPAEIYGKGFMVKLFMENIEAELIHDGYQQVWRV